MTTRMNISRSEADSNYCKTSKVELFAKIVNGFPPLPMASFI